MTTAIDIGTLITRDPKLRGGRPIIAGTGTTVRRVVGLYREGLSPEEIDEELPQLTLAQVYAALTYYHANREEIDADIVNEEAEYERIEKEHYQKKNRP